MAVVAVAVTSCGVHPGSVQTVGRRAATVRAGTVVPAALAAKAADATSAGRTGRYELRFDVTEGSLSSAGSTSTGSATPPAPSTMTIDVVGSYDRGAKSSEVTEKVSMADPTGATSALLDRFMNLSTTTVRVGGVTYEKTSTPAGSPAPAKPWHTVAAGDDSGFVFLDSEKNDPTRLLVMLKDSSADLTAVGQEVVAGQATTRYHGSLDAGRVERDPAFRTSGGQTTAADAADHVVGAPPVDVWIDGAGLVRKLEATIKSSGSGTVGAATDDEIMPSTVTFSLTLLQVGGTVRIVAPPADQVGPYDPTAGFGGTTAGSPGSGGSIDSGACVCDSGQIVRDSGTDTYGS